MSSLQRALDDAANKLKLKTFDTKSQKNIGGGGGGAFENSFAQGLDISEFISTATEPIKIEGRINGDGIVASIDKRTSAAEELLKIKEGERRQRQIEEEEEAKMQEALKKRLGYLKQQANLKNQNRKKSFFEIGDALVRMHNTDEMAATMLSQKTNTRKGGSCSTTTNRRRGTTSRRMSKNSDKSSLIKKSRRMKF